MIDLFASNIYLPNDPLDLLRSWYNGVSEIDNAEAIAGSLATADQDGKPSVRIVLFKSLVRGDFVFFTNLDSKKARELQDNPCAAICFYWPSIARQVRVEGVAHIVAPKEADEYFATRPKHSQIGAYASRQSQPMQSAAELEERLQYYEKKFADTTIERPEFWSGFRLVPTKIEFWQAGEYRLHKRVLYSRLNGVWQQQLLYP